MAKAFVEAGHPTTVWNRGTARAAPAGTVRAESIQDAVTANSLIVTALTTFDATREALTPAAAELAGRTVVTLNSGIPSGARETAAWADKYGAEFLAGAVKNVPPSACSASPSRTTTRSPARPASTSPGTSPCTTCSGGPSRKDVPTRASRHWVELLRKPS